MHAVNHCGQAAAIKEAGMDAAAVQEAVMQRAGEIVTGYQTGKFGTTHKLSGIEMMAQVVAINVIQEGAKKLAGDFSIDFDALKNHAADTHISFC